MADKPGRKPGVEKIPGSGRKKGSINKDRQFMRERAEELGISPYDILLYFAAGDEKALGYDGPQIRAGKDGEPYELPWVTPEMRLKAAIEATQYIIPKLRSVELTGKDGGPVEQTHKVEAVDILDRVKQIKGESE